MKINFASLAKMAEDERKAEFAKMDDEALSAALTEATAEATAIFSKEEKDLTIADADTAEALTAAMGFIEAE